MKKQTPIPPNGEILLYQAPEGTAKMNFRQVGKGVMLNIGLQLIKNEYI